MFIVKGPSAIGWYARGIPQPDVVKQINVPLNTDTVFRIVHNSRHAVRGFIGHSPGTAQALARLGGEPQGILAVPLILRDKLAAILYCDTTQEEIPASDADLVEILVSFAGKTIDLLSVAPKPAAATHSTRARPRSARRRSGRRRRGPRARGRASPAAAAPPPPAPSVRRRRRLLHRDVQRRHLCRDAAGARRRPRGPPRRPPGPRVPAPAAGAGPVPRGAEGARGRQALRASRGERDQALQRVEGQRGPAQQGHLRAAQGRHRARPPDVHRPCARRTSATPRTTSSTSWCGSWPGAMRAPSARCSIVPGALPLASSHSSSCCPRPHPRPYRVTRGAPHASKSSPCATRSRAPRRDPRAVAAEALRRVVRRPSGHGRLRPRAARGRARLPRRAQAQGEPRLPRPIRTSSRRVWPTTRSSRLARAQEALLQGTPPLIRTWPPPPRARRPSLCAALPRAAEAFVKAAGCRSSRPIRWSAPRAAAALQAPRRARFAWARSTRAAATAGPRPLAYDRLDREYPASSGGRRGGAQARRPGLPPAPRSPRTNGPPEACAGGRRFSTRAAHRDAARRLPDGSPSPRSAAERGRPRARATGPRARRRCGATPPPRSCCGDPVGLSACRPRRATSSRGIATAHGRSTEGFADVAYRFPGTPWAEEALLAARQRVPEGRAGRRGRALLAADASSGTRTAATWSGRAGASAWADYRAGRYEVAAQSLEKTARVRAPSSATPGFLYWAGRARAAQGQTETARAALRGDGASLQATPTTACARARRSSTLPPAPAGSSNPSPSLLPASPPDGDLSESQEARVRQLLLDRPARGRPGRARAAARSRAAARPPWPGSTGGAGRLRPAIISMKRAFPEYVAAAGERLPEEVWRILYPIEFEEIAEGQGGRGGARPRAGGRAHPARSRRSTRGP